MPRARGTAYAWQEDGKWKLSLFKKESPANTYDTQEDMKKEAKKRNLEVEYVD